MLDFQDQGGVDADVGLIKLLVSSSKVCKLCTLSVLNSNVVQRNMCASIVKHEDNLRLPDALGCSALLTTDTRDL